MLPYGRVAVPVVLGVALCASVFVNSSGTKETALDSVLFHIALMDASHLDSKDVNRAEEFQKIGITYAGANSPPSVATMKQLFDLDKTKHFENDFISGDEVLRDYVSGRRVDLTIDSTGPNTTGQALSVLFATRIQPLWNWYFSRESAIQANLILFNLKQNLSNFSQDTAHVKKSDADEYFKTHRDKLLGPDLVTKLQQAAFTADQMRSIEAMYLDSLPDIIRAHQDDINPKSPSDQDLSELVTWSKVVVSLESHTHGLKLTQQKFLSSVSDLNVSVGDVATDKKTLSASEVTNVSANLPVIASLLTPGISTSQQLQIVKTDSAGNLSAADKEKVAEALDARGYIEKHRETINSDLANIVQIAKDLGAPADAQVAANEALEVGKLLSDIASEDYVGAAAAIINLFAKNNSPDPNQIRFTQILRELTEIRQLQLATISLLKEIDQKLDRVLGKLENVASNLEAVKTIARENLELDTGFKFCELVQAADPAYFDESGNFRGLEARKQHFATFSAGSKKDYFSKCLTSMDLLFGNSPDRISVLFRQATERDKTFLQDTRYQSALDSIRESMPTFKPLSESKRELRFDRLFSLSMDETKLNKLPGIIPQLESDTAPNYSRFLAKEKFDLLSVAAIYRYVEILLQYYFYPALIDDSGTSLQSPIEVERKSQSPQARKNLNSKLALGKIHLQNALRIVNTAIAQQQLLAGSITIIAMDNELSSFVVPQNVHVLLDGNYSAALQRRKDTAFKVRSDNQRSLWILGYDSAVLSNWIRFIILVELHPEIWKQAGAYPSTTWGAQPNSTTYAAYIAALHADLPPNSMIFPTLTPERISKTAFVNHYCQEVYDYPGYPRGLQPSTATFIIGDRGCLRFEQLFLMPHIGVFENIGIPMPPDYSSKFTMPPPLITNSDETSPELVTPQVSSEMFMLMTLKGRILAALDDYSSFDHLDPKQKAAQITLMTTAARDGQF